MVLCAITSFHSVYHLLYNVGTFSQVIIQESGGGIITPGEDLQLTCTVSGYSVASSGLIWVRQARGNGLDWVGALWNSGSIYYNPAFQNRISIRRDTSKNQEFLQLKSLKPEDTTLYYCAIFTLPCVSAQKLPLKRNRLQSCLDLVTSVWDRWIHFRRRSLKKTILGPDRKLPKLAISHACVWLESPALSLS